MQEKKYRINPLTLVLMGEGGMNNFSVVFTYLKKVDLFKPLPVRFKGKKELRLNKWLLCRAPGSGAQFYRNPDTTMVFFILNGNPDNKN